MPWEIADADQSAERRQLTVLFCDLVASTDLSDRLDAERLREILGRYYDAASEAVRRYDGHVAQYLGDGLLVYLGWPRAHEDDAERAVRVGLAILDAIPAINDELDREPGVRLAARVGIHTGPVVVGEVGDAAHRAIAAHGHTVNVAARLQAVADPDTVVISAGTLRLVQGLFLTEDRGLQALKGLSEPVRAYRVVRASGVRSRLDVAASSGLTPLVGREQELGLLVDRWDAVRESRGQAVLISGEAGIGKSRLAQAFRERIADSPHTWLECRCSPYSQDSALLPVIDLLNQALAFTESMTREARLEQLERALTWAEFAPAETLPLVASLLSLPAPERYPMPALSPEAQRRRTLQILTEWLLRLGRQQPVVLLFEDLHWADPSTLDLLGPVLEQLPTAGVLALYTFRPDFQPPWSARSHVAPMLLARLTRSQVQPMVQALAHGRPVPEAWVREIARRTDGVPLFVEELTRTFLDSELLDEDVDDTALGHALARLEIPATLQDSLNARLDQLGPIKEIAQLAACLGREFDFGLLLAVSPLTESDLADLLRRAVKDEILYQRGQPPTAGYTFKHALIQETAYQSLLKSTRQRHHRRIAETLEARFPELVETQPELVARHCTQAGLTDRAIGYWQRAGQRALQRSASREAIHHFAEGLDLIATLPDTRERRERELQMRAVQGLGLIAVEGYGAERVQQSYARSRELCRELGQTPETFPVLLGLWSFYMVRSERKPTREVSEELLQTAERSGDDSALLEAELAAASTAFWQGSHTEACAHAARVLDLYDAERHGAHALFYGQDPAAYAHSFASLSLWCLGYPDQARDRAAAARAAAQQVLHPFTMAGAECFASMVHLYCGEAEAALRLADGTLSISAEQGFPMWEASAIQWRGIASTALGRLEEGIELLRKGTDQFLATGARVHLHVHLAFLAQGLLGLDRRTDGLEAAEEGLSLTYTNLDCYWAPELHRLKGELLLLDDADPAAAERCFVTALAIAREQQAKSLELRAAMSLARLWDGQDRRPDALELLSRVYGWFTEGLDTEDLRDAKALLASLGSC